MRAPKSWIWLLPLLSLLASPAMAAAPDRAFRTMDTPHFELHFHEGLYPLALHAARSLEKAHELLVPLLGEAPSRRTQVLLTDDTDGANGSATAWGRPQIYLQAAPPDELSVLGDYDDYVFLLVAHEYVHVLHLGTVRGIPRWLNLLLGDFWIPNGLQPRFVTEGMAVYQESHLSSGGRLRSSLFDMYLRADVLEGRMLTLGELANGPDRWPWGTAWYLYGGKLMEYLVQTRGDEALLRYNETYGSNLVPWAMNVDLAEAAGVDFVTLYGEWADAMRERYTAQLATVHASGPLTEPHFRTRFGDQTGSPRFSSQGTLYYVESTPHRRAHLRVWDPKSGVDREVQALSNGGQLAPLPDGTMLLTRQAYVRVHRVNGDLFRLADGDEERLTTGARAAEADVSADGRFAVWVRRDKGRSELVRAPLHQPDRQEVIYRPPEGRQIFGPRFAPDGERVVFTLGRRGAGRDVVILEAGSIRKLTDDGAMDLGPTFTPDGRSVVFSSDRTGIFNLYEVPAEGGTLHRRTNVLSGAFQPTISPDGEWIAWTTYSSYGHDVAAARLDELPRLPVEPYLERTAKKRAPDEGALYPVRPYRPAETLWPQTWFPLYVTDIDGAFAGATLSGSDHAGMHAWNLSAGVGLVSGEPAGGLTWTYNGFFPSLTLGASTTYRHVAGLSADTRERESGGFVALTFPFASMRRFHSLTLGYDARWLQPTQVAAGDEPEEGLRAELYSTFFFSSTERPAEAISPEDGVQASLTFRLGEPTLGSDFEYAALEASAGAFIRLPIRHHVLALLGNGAISTGDLGSRRFYYLGGPVLRDPLLDLIYSGARMGGLQLRGYAPGSFAGSRIILATAEWRMPLLDLDEGPWTLPLHVGDLSLALFAEAGDAFEIGGIRRLHPSAGGELRLNLRVGNLAGMVRLGDAWGFDVDAGGGNQLYLGVGIGY